MNKIRVTVENWKKKFVLKKTQKLEFFGFVIDSNSMNIAYIAEAYLDPSGKSTMELFIKIVNG